MKTECCGNPLSGCLDCTPAPAAPAAEPVALTDEQIADLAKPKYNAFAQQGHFDYIAFARTAITEFCRINGIGAPHG